MMKYIFVTGGVVSSIGKGLAAASIGTLLEHRGLKVLMQKFDPYLNVDPGNMSPFQHGEVYVLDDGAETDLDLGHYERFTSGKLTRLNSMSSGQVFESVIRKERQGDYGGATVQFIPHVTSEIKERMHEVTRANSGVDVLITEIGGTVGDIEGLLFIEALRQFALEVGQENVCFIHVTLLPYIKAAGEVKTKPTQQSVAKLRELGIHPDIIICRTEANLDDDNRRKIAMFCNVAPKNVVAFRDVAHSIYECPLDLRRDKIDRLVVDKIGLGHTPAPELEEWERFVQRIIHPKKRINIAVVGKYGLQDAYKSVYEALVHAGALHNTRVKILRIDSEALEAAGPDDLLQGVDGILVPGGFGDRGVDGKIMAARYAREHGIPFFGIGLGMQLAVIEFVRDVCKLEGATSTEFAARAPHQVIILPKEPYGVDSKGGTMRLGGWDAYLIAGTLAAGLYGDGKMIRERHRHRCEFNDEYRELVEEAGMVISAVSAKEGLVEIIELPAHPFFIGVQFHAEFQSKPNHPHPLFAGFVEAALRVS